MLHAAPALAARFPVIAASPATLPPISLPSCRPWPPKPDSTLTPDAARKAAAVLADAERGHVTGNARLAVQLLTQATTNQAYRVTTSAQPCDPAALCADDIPERMPVPAPSPCDQHPGQYL